LGSLEYEGEQTKYHFEIGRGPRIANHLLVPPQDTNSRRDQKGIHYWGNKWGGIKEKSPRDIKGGE